MSLIERLKLESELKSTVTALNYLFTPFICSLPINRQVVPKIYDTFSKEVRPDRVIAEVFKNLIRVASSRAGP